MLRIIAGDNKGSRLVSAPGNVTRPTLARVRESLFSILGAAIIDADVVDLFAGNGTFGLEALSRGAKSCVFVESSRHALEALRSNIQKLGRKGESELVTRDVISWLGGSPDLSPAGIIFLDPPYDRDLAWKSIEVLSEAILSDDCLVVVQAGTRDKLPEKVSQLVQFRCEKYGETVLRFYSVVRPACPDLK